jgi:integrase
MKKQLLGSSLSNTSIKKMANGINPNQDYIQFCKEIIPVKYPKPTQSETRRQHLSELSKLEQFRSPVYFSDLNHQFLTEYRAWMINERGNTDNTVWKSLKAMYAMTNEALKVGGYLAESPFKNFDRGRYQQGRRKFLNVEDCVKLEAKLQEQGINERLRLVGYYFLFMCYAGFRFQDAIKQFDYDKHVIDGERIVLKTGKFGVDVDILIHNRLASVLEFIRHNPLTEAEYTFNRNLKDLQKLAGIDVDLTAHVGRHTFGTMLAELDVPIEKAQMLLGHRDLESTKIYYHIKNKSLDKEMEKFNKFSNLKL